MHKILILKIALCQGLVGLHDKRWGDREAVVLCRRTLKKAFRFKTFLSLVYLSLLSVLFEWSHFYRICQLGLVNVFFVAEKVLLLPDHDAHANERERTRGWCTWGTWLLMFYSTGANPKGGEENTAKRDKENEGGINYSVSYFPNQKVTIRHCNIDLLHLFLNVCLSPTVLHIISIYMRVYVCVSVE